MHKRLVNHCTIELTLSPQGPMLIKSGKEGADPTKPDMEFVETYHDGWRSIYLPGSSLKGAIRAHAERIVRTVGNETRNAKEARHLWASNPLNLKDYDYLDSYSETADIYKWSSFTDQLFGSPYIASRLRIEDARPVDRTQIKMEERNGVAIDRVFGSVAVGPFNYEVCTAGTFKTKIHLKNFSLAQLGLISLVLRDLNDGWFGIGFAKSRGMGQVAVTVQQAILQYPGCVLVGEEPRKIKLLGSHKQSWDQTALLGAGEFLPEEEAKKYGFPARDRQSSSPQVAAMALGFGVQLTWVDASVSNLFEEAVKSWCQAVPEVTV